MTASLTQPAFRRLGMKALLVQHDIDERTATGRAATALAELRSRLVDVVIATSADDARAVVAADPAIQCLLLSTGNSATTPIMRPHRPCSTRCARTQCDRARVPCSRAARARPRFRSTRCARPTTSSGCWRTPPRSSAAASRRRDRALPRNRAAADVPRTREVSRVRILVAHARPHGRHRVPEIAGRSCVLRILRRIVVPLRPVDLGRRTRLAARSLTRSAKANAMRRACSARIARIT